MCAALLRGLNLTGGLPPALRDRRAGRPSRQKFGSPWCPGGEEFGPTKERTGVGDWSLAGQHLPPKLPSFQGCPRGHPRTELSLAARRKGYSAERGEGEGGVPAELQVSAQLQLLRFLMGGGENTREKAHLLLTNQRRPKRPSSLHFSPPSSLLHFSPPSSLLTRLVPHQELHF